MQQNEEPYSEEELVALAELKAFLAPSIAAAKKGEFATVTIEEVIAEAKAERRLS